MDYPSKQRAAFRKLEQQAGGGATMVAMSSDFENDKRLCLTACCFIGPVLGASISEKLIKTLREIEPEHYYYPVDSMHVTLRNVQTIADPPTFGPREVKLAADALRECLRGENKFKIDLKELFVMPTSLSVCGFSSDALQRVADKMGLALFSAGVPDNKVYSSAGIVFGNVTFCRYAHEPSPAFLAAVEKLRETRIGALNVSAIRLITTNAGCHPDHTRIIETFRLS
jgi:2'-5' RNA ligase